jgi:hypothetical protein
MGNTHRFGMMLRVDVFIIDNLVSWGVKQVGWIKKRKRNTYLLYFACLFYFVLF